MRFESKLTEYFKEAHQLDSNDIASSGLDSKRRAEVFSLAQTSCQAKEASGSIEKSTSLRDTTHKLKNRHSKPKPLLQLYLPYAIAAMLLLAVVHVVWMKQTTHSVTDMQANISISNTDNADISNQSIEKTLETHIKQTQEIISNNDASTESEAMLATRGVINGNIEMPVYEGNVNPNLQVQPTLVGENSEADSSMVIYILEESLGSASSKKD